MQSIFLTIPSFAPHGGIRIIMEWANRLAEHHLVYLRVILRGNCDWFPLSDKVTVVYDDAQLDQCDAVIVTSPHSAHYLFKTQPARKVVFLQMMEDMFQVGKYSHKWRAKCELLYRAPCPLITISDWGRSRLIHQYGRKPESIHYIGNGVNLDHFPINPAAQKEKAVLVEGWVPGNPTKDTARLGPSVAKYLRSAGYRVLAYGGVPLGYDIHKDDLDEYYQNPSVDALNSLYSRAMVLIKASRYDFRSCSPMEAMTKGTVTARAITLGDDDLKDMVNCLRRGYDDHLFGAAAALLREDGPRERLSQACLDYVQSEQCSWDHWIPIIEDIIWSS